MIIGVSRYIEYMGTDTGDQFRFKVLKHDHDTRHIFYMIEFEYAETVEAAQARIDELLKQPTVDQLFMRID